MTDALKPCPFCGNSGAQRIVSSRELCVICEESDESNTESLAVVCDASNGKKGCGASSGYRKNENEAIAAWNTRAADTRIAELEAECERLRKDAERYRWLRDNGEEMIKADRGMGPSWTYGKELDDKIVAAIKGSER